MKQPKLTAISCIKSAASAISPCPSLIFASFLIKRALSISTYIYRTMDLILKNQKKTYGVKGRIKIQFQISNSLGFPISICTCTQ